MALLERSYELQGSQLESNVLQELNEVQSEFEADLETEAEVEYL